MTRIKKAAPPVTLVALVAGFIGYLLGTNDSLPHPAAGASDAVATTLVAAQDQSAGRNAAAAPKKRPDAWYPRTEKVATDEMFVVALGTGMPTPITKGQKSTAWYVELGNGDIFLFDCGTGSAENLFALRPDMHRVESVCMGHFWASGDSSRRRRRTDRP